MEEQPVRVRGVRIAGLQRTRASVIDNEIRFSNVKEAKTMGELVQGLVDVVGQLRGLDVFSDANILVDMDDKQENKDVVDLNLDVKVKEAEKLKMTAAVESSGLESSELKVNASLRNMFGYAEKFYGSCAWGTRLSDLESGFFAPRIGNTLWNFKANVNITTLDRLLLSSYKEKVKGLTVGFALPQLAAHSITYNLAWRDVNVSNHVASKAVREDSGPSLKSSVSHVYEQDGSEWGPFYPMTGVYRKVETELAGIGGDAQFFKQEAAVRAYFPLFDVLAASIDIRAGVLAAYGGYTSKVNDRFSVKLPGFRSGGVGPSAKRHQNGEQTDSRPDALGGDIFTALRAAVAFPLPSMVMQSLGMYGQVFTCMGNSAMLSHGSHAVSDQLVAFRDSMRFSVGAGLVFPLGRHHIEVDYCVPIRYCKGDRPKPGFAIRLATMSM